MNENHHEMTLDKIHISGVEEWSCPTCGRRFLVQWPPAYKIIVLQPGDKDTQHSLTNDSLRMSSSAVPEKEETGLIEEFRLLPWRKWMEKIDFDPQWGDHASYH
jgi:hypothetical protein